MRPSVKTSDSMPRTVMMAKPLTSGSTNSRQPTGAPFASMKFG